VAYTVSLAVVVMGLVVEVVVEVVMVEVAEIDQ